MSACLILDSEYQLNIRFTKNGVMLESWVSSQDWRVQNSSWLIYDWLSNYIVWANPAFENVENKNFISIVCT